MTQSFADMLQQHDLTLVREETRILQVNVGLVCDMACAHCHLEAGPARTESMSPETMQQVAVLASQYPFELIDITGGAPEMNPHLPEFIDSLSRIDTPILLRSNLSALRKKGASLTHLLREKRINLVTSFPSLNEIQAESIRGKGFFHKGIETFQELNQMGYGRTDSDLTLDIVVNPSGAFLSPSQKSMEKRYKETLKRKWGITFNQLFSFANMPLGRFRTWLARSGNLDAYMDKIRSAFNPCAVEGLMCRSLLSISWDGYLFDCDFNQADHLYLGNRKTHITEMTALPEPGSPIAVGDHCYTCTAGAGFT